MSIMLLTLIVYQCYIRKPAGWDGTDGSATCTAGTSVTLGGGGAGEGRGQELTGGVTAQTFRGRTGGGGGESAGLAALGVSRGNTALVCTLGHSATVTLLPALHHPVTTQRGEVLQPAGQAGGGQHQGDVG